MDNNFSKIEIVFSLTDFTLASANVLMLQDFTWASVNALIHTII